MKTETKRDLPMTDAEFQRIIDGKLHEIERQKRYMDQTEDVEIEVWELPRFKGFDMILGLGIVVIAGLLAVGGLYLIWLLAH